MNTESLKAKLLNISREKEINFQELLNRFGSEQFLARLSMSSYTDRLVFKGGTLLTYIIETGRRTRDLDFSVFRIGNKLEDVLSLIGKILDILAYPPETIFSEKLHIALKRAGANTRMKDYYDMYKLVLSEGLDESLLKSSINDTFKKRETEVQTEIAFDATTVDRLQGYWTPFLRKMKLKDAPSDLNDVIAVINKGLKNIHGSK